MKILVTGGSGFIGTHLCKKLTEEGHFVRILDLKKPSENNSGVECRLGDVRKSVDLNNAIQGVDAVFHLAAIVSVPVCQQKPVESYHTNLLGSVQVLEAIQVESMRSQKKICYAFASSAAVYGRTGQLHEGLSEEMPLPPPLSFYAAQKRGAEQVAGLFAEDRGVPVLNFRFFNVFGPGQDPKSPYSGVISIFTSALNEERSLSLHGGGHATRDFISVYDVCSALVSSLRVPVEVWNGQCINLGSGKGHSVKVLAETMMLESGKRVPLIDMPAREGDVPHSLADISKAKELLGWEPQTSLEDGLRELLELSK